MLQGALTAGRQLRQQPPLPLPLPLLAAAALPLPPPPPLEVEPPPPLPPPRAGRQAPLPLPRPLLQAHRPPLQPQPQVWLAFLGRNLAVSQPRCNHSFVWAIEQLVCHSKGTRVCAGC